MNRTHFDSLEAARERLGLSVWQLWVDYVALGGNLPSDEFEAFLRHGHTEDAHNFDLIVQALNEVFIERGEDHPLPYADELPPRSG